MLTYLVVKQNSALSNERASSQALMRSWNIAIDKQNLSNQAIEGYKTVQTALEAERSGMKAEIVSLTLQRDELRKLAPVGTSIDDVLKRLAASSPGSKK